MKDKLARESIRALGEQTQRDYDIHIQNSGSIRLAHECLLKYLGLELKHTTETVTYAKRRKK